MPVLVHVKELTQPIGHSTSGSHERYKTLERLEWEKINDCNIYVQGITEDHDREIVIKSFKDIT